MLSQAREHRRPLRSCFHSRESTGDRSDCAFMKRDRMIRSFFLFMRTRDNWSLLNYAGNLTGPVLQSAANGKSKVPVLFLCFYSGSFWGVPAFLGYFPGVSLTLRITMMALGSFSGPRVKCSVLSISPPRSFSA